MDERPKNALEEGLTIVDNKASSIIEETKEIQIRRKPASPSSYMPNSSICILLETLLAEELRLA